MEGHLDLLMTGDGRNQNLQLPLNLVPCPNFNAIICHFDDGIERLQRGVSHIG